MSTELKEGDVLIEIKDLRKVYRTDDSEVVAIDRIDLDIKKGELVSIVGPSGCGKTTILRMIAGLLEPTEGEILIKGARCGDPGSDRGVVFQDYALFPWRTVKKNVEFGMEVAGVPKDERSRRAEKYIELVGLKGFENSMVHTLSGGMKQRVGIARTMVNHPDIILMDEPFGALDSQTRNIMQGQLKRILEKTEQTIIFITHSVEEAVFLSDRIVILTRRPSTIKEIIDIDLPKDRDRTDPRFIELRRRILESLEKENVMNG